MEIECQQCGARVVGETDTGMPSRCPLCGAELDHQAGAGDADGDELGIATRVLPDREDAVEPDGAQDRSTLFQPAMMVDDAAREESLDGSDAWLQAPHEASTQAPDAEPCLVIAGAPPGTEPILLKAAQTTFGRADADVILADATLSAPHFQIDVVGSEFFVRDLDSRGGTFLNDHPISHSELLSGDRLRVGETTLVFKTSQS